MVAPVNDWGPPDSANLSGNVALKSDTGKPEWGVGTYDNRQRQIRAIRDRLQQGRQAGGSLKPQSMMCHV